MLWEIKYKAMIYPTMCHDDEEAPRESTLNLVTLLEQQHGIVRTAYNLSRDKRNGIRHGAGGEDLGEREGGAPVGSVDLDVGVEAEMMARREWRRVDRICGAGEFMILGTQ